MLSLPESEESENGRFFRMRGFLGFLPWIPWIPRILEQSQTLHVVDKNILQVTRACSLPQFLQSVAGKYAPAVDDGDTIAQLFGFAHDVSRKHNGFSLIAKLLDDLLHLERVQHVEADRGFIEDQQRRIVGHGPGD